VSTFREGTRSSTSTGTRASRTVSRSCARAGQSRPAADMYFKGALFSTRCGRGDDDRRWWRIVPRTSPLQVQTIATPTSSASSTGDQHDLRDLRAVPPAHGHSRPRTEVPEPAFVSYRWKLTCAIRHAGEVGSKELADHPPTAECRQCHEPDEGQFEVATDSTSSASTSSSRLAAHWVRPGLTQSGGGVDDLPEACGLHAQIGRSSTCPRRNPRNPAALLFQPSSLAGVVVIVSSASPARSRISMRLRSAGPSRGCCRRGRCGTLPSSSRQLVASTMTSYSPRRCRREASPARPWRRDEVQALGRAPATPDDDRRWYGAIGMNRRSSDRRQQRTRRPGRGRRTAWR